MGRKVKITTKLLVLLLLLSSMLYAEWKWVPLHYQPNISFGCCVHAAYDPQTQSIMLVSNNGETWRFDGYNWTLLATDDLGNCHIVRMDMAIDPLSGELLDFRVCASGAMDVWWTDVYRYIEGEGWELTEDKMGGDGAYLAVDPDRNTIFFPGWFIWGATLWYHADYSSSEGFSVVSANRASGDLLVAYDNHIDKMICFSYGYNAPVKLNRFWVEIKVDLSIIYMPLKGGKS